MLNELRDIGKGVEQEVA